MKIKSFIGGLSVKQNKRLPQLSRKVYKLKGASFIPSSGQKPLAFLNQS